MKKKRSGKRLGKGNLISTNVGPDEKRESKGRPSMYPWDDWLKPGTRWLLIKGQDFDCEVGSIAFMAYRQAWKRERKTSIFKTKDSVIIQTPRMPVRKK